MYVCNDYFVIIYHAFSWNFYSINRHHLVFCSILSLPYDEIKLFEPVNFYKCGFCGQTLLRRYPICFW